MKHPINRYLNRSSSHKHQQQQQQQQQDPEQRPKNRNNNKHGGNIDNNNTSHDPYPVDSSDDGDSIMFGSKSSSSFGSLHDNNNNNTMSRRHRRKNRKNNHHNDKSSNPSLGSYNNNNDNVTEHHLADKETKAVVCLKFVVITVLLLVTIAISVTMYTTTDNAQMRAFEIQFTRISWKITNAFEAIPINRLAVMASLSTAIAGESQSPIDIHQANKTYYSSSTNSTNNNNNSSSTWPFVTLPFYHERARNVLDITDALFVASLPLVQESDRAEWERYTRDKSLTWMDAAKQYEIDSGMVELADLIANETMYGTIHYTNNNNESIIDLGPGPYLPVWEQSPLRSYYKVNSNILRDPVLAAEAKLCIETESIVIGQFRTGIAYDTIDPQTTFITSLLQAKWKEEDEIYDGCPINSIFIPIFDSFREIRKLAGILMFIVEWDMFFDNLLPPDVRNIIFVLDNHCQVPYTYSVDGTTVEQLGKGDLHDRRFSSYVQTTTLQQFTSIPDGSPFGMNINNTYCPIEIRVYPSVEFYESFVTKTPTWNALVVATVMLFAVLLFFIFERLVERRQKLVLQKALQSSAIVSSLFPKSVQERLMAGKENNNGTGGKKTENGSKKLRSFLNGDDDEDDADTILNDEVIADLFPNTTVLFADICGFTAWSSSREPRQVFILLQTVYQNFDQLAKRRRVYKVETIGDSYVAVTGLPDPQPKHATIMARFAYECLECMTEFVRDLEPKLGPDTAELTMRFGLHSGPVTAGVLKGERARFQLFGDTVNTASRMESNGKRGKIQISESTAQILIASGKEHWIKPREDAIVAKGKGTMKTYWLNPANTPSSNNETTTASVSTANKSLDEFLGTITGEPSDSLRKNMRLVSWICETLQESIQLVMANSTLERKESSVLSSHDLVLISEEGSTALDELTETISLRKYLKVKSINEVEPEKIYINGIVKEELRDLVTSLAAMYQDNPFHNFEHACHVTMSVRKLMSRIVTFDLDSDSNHQNTHDEKKSPRGINLDPLAMLAITFSAVLHDVDHRGVSNIQLMKEDKGLADYYKNKSVAEQNSLDVAWNLFMSDRYKNLRHCIFESRAELIRFRQIIVNVVLATDIFDKDLNAQRSKRWEKAFSQDASNNNNNSDLRATVVIEHLIQASDVAHTMQHWQVYSKWNKSLYQEMSSAYRSGRMGTDPAQFWYKGELAFFDNYIIPLANKLKECHVFGVSSDEYLNNALQNRSIWESQGQEIVEEMTSIVRSNSVISMVTL